MKKRIINPGKWMLLSALVLLFISCQKSSDTSPVIEKEVNLSGFNKIYSGDKFKLSISKGNEFSVKLRGVAADVDDVEMSVTNNILDIQYKHFENYRSQVEVFITVPQFVQLNLAGAGIATINGFEGANNVIRAVLSGASKCTLNGSPVNAQVDMTGTAQLEVNGATLSLFGTISGNAILKAYNLTATEVDLAGSGASVAYVKVTDRLFAEASGASCIFYKGNPGIKSIVKSGGGDVIQQ